MISPKKIHEWLLKALEEPFFRAEMYKVEILLKNSKNNGMDHSIEESKTSQGGIDHDFPEKKLPINHSQR